MLKIGQKISFNYTARRVLVRFLTWKSIRVLSSCILHKRFNKILETCISSCYNCSSELYDFLKFFKQKEKRDRGFITFAFLYHTNFFSISGKTLHCFSVTLRMCLRFHITSAVRKLCLFSRMSFAIYLFRFDVQYSPCQRKFLFSSKIISTHRWNAFLYLEIMSLMTHSSMII